MVKLMFCLTTSITFEKSFSIVGIYIPKKHKFSILIQKNSIFILFFMLSEINFKFMKSHISKKIYLGANVEGIAHYI